MALIANASGDYVRRTENLPASSDAFTIAGWFYRSSDRAGGGSYEDVLDFNMFDGVDPWDHLIEIRPSWETPSGNCMSLRSTVGGGLDAWSSRPAVDTWFYVAMTSHATNGVRGYWYDASFNLVESKVASITPVGTKSPRSTVTMSHYSDTGRYVDGKCAYVRVWDAALTQSEIEAEMASSVIVRTANINTAFGKDSGTDVSGNSRDWTLNSITTDADGPSFPATITASRVLRLRVGAP